MTTINVDNKEYNYDEINKLIITVNRQKKQKQNVLDKLTNLQDKYEKLEKNYETYKSDYKNVVQERNKLSLKLESKGMSKDHIQQYDKYKEFYNKWSSQVDNLENKQPENAVNQIYVDQIIDLEDKIKVLQEENKQIKVLQQENEKIKVLNEQIKVLQKENEKLKSQKNEKPQDNLYINDDKDNIISTLKEEIAELKAELKSKKPQSNNNNDKKQIQELKKQNDILKSTIESIEKVVDEKIVNKKEVVEEKIMDSISTQTDFDDKRVCNEEKKDIKVADCANNEYSQDNVWAVFDAIYGDMMTYKNGNNKKLANNLMNKRKDMCNIISGTKTKKDETRRDYGVDMIKYIIDLTNKNKKLNDRVNTLIDKL